MSFKNIKTIFSIKPIVTQNALIVKFSFLKEHPLRDAGQNRWTAIPHMKGCVLEDAMAAPHSTLNS